MTGLSLPSRLSGGDTMRGYFYIPSFGKRGGQEGQERIPLGPSGLNPSLHGGDSDGTEGHR